MPPLSPTLQRADFEPHVGSTFAATLGDRSFPLTLAQTEALGGGRPGVRPPFLLIFLAPVGTPPAQGVHVLSHDALGELELFLVPAAPGPDGAPRLVATFN